MHKNETSHQIAKLSFWQIVFFSPIQMVCCWAIFAAITQLVELCAGSEIILQFMNASWCGIVVFVIWTACAFQSYYIISAAGNMFEDNRAYSQQTDTVCDAEYESC